MPFVVVGQTAQINHPAGKGNWWTLDTLYMHSLLHDPLIIAMVGRTPTVAPGDQVDADSSSLCVFARRTLAADRDIVARLGRAGSAMVLNRPETGLLDRPAPRQTIESLRERWDIGSTRLYYIGDLDQFDVYDPSDADRVLSWIGENPDAMLRGTTALLAGNPWTTIFRYLNTPALSHLLLDFADLLGRIIAGLLHRPDPRPDRFGAHAGLRRDFHAFGYAVFSIEQLQRSYGVCRVDLSEANAAAVRAARALVDGNDEKRAQDILRSAFEMLERQNRSIQPEPAIFTDTLHAGGLFSDIGYCEFDWPQHAADVLHNHLDWAEHRNYRFNLDFAAQSLDQLCLRYPRLAGRLRNARERGWIDLVNGTWNQPYPPFFSLPSMLRQFDLGIETMRQRFGATPTTYASQEFGFAPQLAEILSQYGYQGAVMRVQNMGDAPTHSAPLVRWTSPGGERGVPALPSHPYKSEQRNEVTYNNVHLKIFAGTQARHPSPPIFTGLGDLTYYRPFREEMARISFYANVFGRFTTWRDFFAARRDAKTSAFQPRMEDFDCRAAFLDIETWQHLRPTMGGSIEHCMRSHEASELFRAVEMLDAMAPTSAPAPHHEFWRALASYQGHDSYFSPNFPSGAFMGGSTGPTSHHGRAIQTVSDYRGVWDAITLGQRSGRELKQAVEQAQAHVRQRLNRADTDARPLAYAIFNPGMRSRRVVRFENAAGAALVLNGKVLPVQDDGDDRLALVEAPASCCLSVLAIKPADSIAVSHPVRAGDDWIDNGLLRVEFDPSTGIIRQLIARNDQVREQLLVAEGHRFAAPGGGPQRCVNVRRLADGPLVVRVEFTLVIPMPQHGDECRIRSCVSLQADQNYLEFHQTIDHCPRIEGDQWQSRLAMQFDLPADGFELQRSHFNVMESSRDRRIFSPNLLLAQKLNQRIAMLNKGNAFYVRDVRTISALLVVENEPARIFSHAIGMPRGNALSEARAWASPWFTLPVLQNAFSCQAIDVGSGDVELLSITRDPAHRLIVRLANLAGAMAQSVIRLPDAIVAAWRCDLTGRRMEPFNVGADGALAVALGPWAILQIEIETDRSN